MRWPMEILRIYVKEQLHIKYYVIKPLIFPKIQNVMHINPTLLQWFINCLIKRPLMHLKEKGLILM